MSKKKSNTMLAFSEWMDVHSDGYLIAFTNNGNSGLIMNGRQEDLVAMLASGMIDHQELRNVIEESLFIVIETERSRMKN